MRRILSMMAVAALAAAVVGSAAALNVDGGVIQVGSDTDLRCDTDGGVTVNWGFEMNDENVYTVRVSDISTNCIGSELYVNITDDGTVVRELGPVLLSASNTGANSASLSLGSPYSAEQITDVHVGIEGPAS